MLGELVPMGGGDPIPMLKSKLLVGRRDGCDICLRFPNVSSHHCELELIDGYWRVRDLGSRNGIKVNNIRTDSRWLLPGDELSIAKHRYEVKYVPTSDGPPPENEDSFNIPLLEKAGLVKRDADDDDAGSAPRRSTRAGKDARTAPGGKPGPSNDDLLGNRPTRVVDRGSFAPGGLPAEPAPAKKPDSDESIALKWLEAADDENEPSK